MTLTAAVLLIISSLTHAGWNLFSKKDQPSTASFLLANLCGLVLLLPLLIFGWHQIVEMIQRLWPLILLTGFFQALYFSGLAYAYKTGELSIAYPLARSLPVLLVSVVIFLSGKGGAIGATVLFGMSLIIVGGFLIPLESFKDFSFHRYKSVAIAAALVAAVGTAGYSLTDDYALGLLRAGRAAALNDNALLAMYYIGLQGFTTVIWQGAVVILNKKERQLLIKMSAHPVSSIIKGAGIFLTYSLVLISMGYVTNVSYVVAFRQLSIPIGLIFGIFFLRERICGPKITAVVLLFSGVVLVGLG